MLVLTPVVCLLQMLSARVLQDEFRKIHEELSDPVKDWRLRVGAVSTFSPGGSKCIQPKGGSKYIQPGGQ